MWFCITQRKRIDSLVFIIALSSILSGSCLCPLFRHEVWHEFHSLPPPHQFMRIWGRDSSLSNLPREIEGEDFDWNSWYYSTPLVHRLSSFPVPPFRLFSPDLDLWGVNNWITCRNVNRHRARERGTSIIIRLENRGERESMKLHTPGQRTTRVSHIEQQALFERRRMY